jgi:hypothetical protein
MNTVLTIKDLAHGKELDRKAMSAVRGGLGNQANATQQSNLLQMKAPVAVGNGTDICGPANFQVDSNPIQTATNDSTSTNFSGLGWYPVCAD